MTLTREKVRQEDWEFFNALDIQFMSEHIMADEYSAWVIDRERKIVFTRVQTPGRDYGDTYILLWGETRVYIYVDSWTTLPGSDGIREYHWDIQRITAPLSLQNRRDKLIELIREVSVLNFYTRSSTRFVIDNISEPHYIEQK
ncbi:protein of unknown function [Petrocella atlantisensis]|uniref:Uncharacterized protein n=1 Tax=Petrocella atlantisensis TaxID=2173034 RepID=A0A3P7Q194_9FIRM|nr:hypothetical protein [Petrocella atlantisensis]VDN49131.1 protein of unknown function [Petrocella atlantisensis]